MLQHKLFDLRDCAEAIQAQAAASPAREVCGVVLHTGEVIPIDNIAAADDEFELGAEFDQYRDRTACIYHSHIGESTPASLSPADILNAKEQCIPYLCYHPQFYQWDYFDPTALHPFPLEITQPIPPTQIEYYLLWRFDYGRSDCYSLARAWYAGMLGIDLGDYPRLPLDGAPPQFDFERFEQQGFVQVPKDEFQTHDLLCMDILGGRFNHIGIIANAEMNQLLQNVGEGRYSEVLPYDQSWRDRTRAVFRHHLLMGEF